MTKSEKETLLKNLTIIERELANQVYIVDSQPLDSIESLSEREYIDYKRIVTDILYNIRQLDIADITYREYLLRKNGTRKN